MAIDMFQWRQIIYLFIYLRVTKEYELYAGVHNFVHRLQIHVVYHNYNHSWRITESSIIVNIYGKFPSCRMTKNECTCKLMVLVLIFSKKNIGVEKWLRIKC